MTQPVQYNTFQQDSFPQHAARNSYKPPNESTLLRYCDSLQITLEKNANLTQRNALHLRQVWEKVLIRRTYAFQDLANLTRTIGEDMAGLYIRCLKALDIFSENEQHN
jgi:hypothetical protein